MIIKKGKKDCLVRMRIVVAFTDNTLKLLKTFENSVESIRSVLLFLLFNQGVIDLHHYHCEIKGD